MMTEVNAIQETDCEPGQFYSWVIAVTAISIVLALGYSALRFAIGELGAQAMATAALGCSAALAGLGWAYTRVRWMGGFTSARVLRAGFNVCCRATREEHIYQDDKSGERGSLLFSQLLVTLAAVYSTYRLAVSPGGLESLNWCVFLAALYVVSICLGLQWASAARRVRVSLVLPAEDVGA